MFTPRYRTALPARWLSGLLLGGMLLLVCGEAAMAQGLRLRDICRLKGQETNILQGTGLVVGLRGTGDGDLPTTAKMLGKVMQRMGAPMSVGLDGTIDASELGEAKNAAIVFVTAEVPAVGAQQGDRIDVQVNAINAKSLEGGTLLLTSMLGPNPNNPYVFGLASGKLEVAAGGPATTATIERGCKMEQTIRMPFEKDGVVTLVLNPHYADFDTTQRVADTINSLSEVQTGGSSPGERRASNFRHATAIDQLHIEVVIPTTYLEDPISFISGMMDAPISLESRSNRVVINEKEGIVIIGEDVEIAPTLVIIDGISIEAKAAGSLVPLDPNAPTGGNPKLKALADSLNALEAPASTLIEIIKTLEAKGDLYGEVVPFK